MVTSGEGDRFDVEFALVEEPRHLEPGDGDREMNNVVYMYARTQSCTPLCTRVCTSYDVTNSHMVVEGSVLFRFEANFAGELEGRDLERKRGCLDNRTDQRRRTAKNQRRNI